MLFKSGVAFFNNKLQNIRTDLSGLRCTARKPAQPCTMSPNKCTATQFVDDRSNSTMSTNIPYWTKLRRTNFSSDKIFRGKNFSSPLEIIV